MEKSPPLSVLYEDNHVIAVEKPDGILSQGDISGETSMLDMVREYIKRTRNKPGNVYAGLVHRLDRPVSGVMVFARTSKAARRLHVEFSGRRVVKLYATLIPEFRGEMERWHHLEHYVERIKDKTVVIAEETGSSRKASLMYYPLVTENGRTLVLANLLTGRKHQIRAQFAHEGYPVAGDDRYGSVEGKALKGIMLHSLYLCFKHPTTGCYIELYSEIPERMSRLITASDTVTAQMQDIISELCNHEDTEQGT